MSDESVTVHVRGDSHHLTLFDVGNATVHTHNRWKQFLLLSGRILAIDTHILIRQITAPNGCTGISQAEGDVNEHL
jgi:hypothetical protein